ncbi:hypothetical protein AMATHDRAFT_6984 [Amanita thiersii Skay4041]|uniref:Uncharacterized protein n=1 Tax=Amanita thiersii Skay4041 TaxID=703135 RepID=A0A2A9NG17_9AGAR|nr:hypothetical protein AMATHDRAFT_6984 [Amanita thiersii Skay4041]
MSPTRDFDFKDDHNFENRRDPRAVYNGGINVGNNVGQVIANGNMNYNRNHNPPLPPCRPNIAVYIVGIMLVISIILAARSSTATQNSSVTNNNYGKIAKAEFLNSTVNATDESFRFNNM